MSASIYRNDIPTVLGTLIAVATDEAITALYFEGQKHLPAQLPPPTPPNALLRALRAQVSDYFDGSLTRFDLPLAPRGSAFQQAVWQALLAIPHGATVSYGELAARLGRPAAVRAVGAAIGRNPLSIVIPCHRVVGKGGDLTGYAGGLPRKAALLALERP